MAEKQAIATASQQGAALIVNNKFIDELSKQLRQKEEYGLSFPADYNPTNALMGAYLQLKETNDKNGKCVLETCSQASIANCLMDMVTKGLNMQKKQCYPIAYGGKLQCQVSYHGWKAMAHRYGVKTIDSECIYDGDVFQSHLENGRKILDKHEQDFMNIDTDKIKGAYCVITLNDGSRYIEVMNINQIKTSWRKGFGYKENSGTHKDFTDMMAKKTVTARACRQIVQQYGDAIVVDSVEKDDEFENVDVVAENVAYDIQQNANSVDFDEAPDPNEGHVVDYEPEKEVAETVQTEEEQPAWMQ